MPLVVSTDTIFPFIVGKAIYSRIVISLIFGLWAVLAFRDPSFRIPRSWLVLILGIYLFISLLAGIFGVSFQRSLWSTFERMQGVVDLAHWLALLVVLISVIRTNTNSFYLLNANMGVSLLVAFIGLDQAIEGQSLPFYRFLQADQRIGITLGNPAFAATYLMLNAIVGMGLLLRSFWPSEQNQSAPQARRRRSRRRQQQDTVDIKPILWRAFWILVVVVNLWVMTLTGTRGAVIGLIAGLGFFSVGYVIIGNQTVLKRSMLALVGIAILLGITVISLRNTPVVKAVASNNVLLQRMTDLSADQDPFTSRLFALTVGYKALLERPILGWGPENYIVPYGKYYVTGISSLEVLDQAHNKPIEELVTKGILGLASYLAIWFFIFRIVFKRARHADPRNQIFILTIGSALAAYFVQNLFLFDTPASTLQFIIFVSIIVGVETRDAAPSLDESATPGPDSGSGFLGAAGRFVTAVRSRPAISIKLALAGLVATIVLVTMSLWVNIMVYRAATAIIEVTRGVSSLDAALATVSRSISSFPPLANYPRLIYIKNVGDIWLGLSEADAQRVVDFAEQEANNAIAVEPENWRIYVSMGEMHLDIVSQRSGFEGLDSAIHYLEIAEILAPERQEVLRLRRLVEWEISQRSASSQQ